MTVLSWPGARKRPGGMSARKMIVNPLPRAVLDHFAADIPGPGKETETERDARLAANREAILRFHPSNTAEAMLASHFIVMTRLLEQSRLARRDNDPNAAKNHARAIRQILKRDKEMGRLLAIWQSRPAPDADVAMTRALGLTPEMIPDPDDPAQPQDAVSAVIVPLHPAPDSLQ